MGVKEVAATAFHGMAVLGIAATFAVPFATLAAAVKTYDVLTGMHCFAHPDSQPARSLACWCLCSAEVLLSADGCLGVATLYCLANSFSPARSPARFAGLCCVSCCLVILRQRCQHHAGHPTMAYMFRPTPKANPSLASWLAASCFDCQLSAIPH